MTLSLVGERFQIDGGGRPRTFEVHDNIVQLWFEADAPSLFEYGERMFVTVVGSDGTELIDETSLGQALDFDVAPSGFGQNAFHVSEGPGGAYVIHYSEFINGHSDASGAFVPYAETRISVTMAENGALSAPVEVGAGFIKFEDSDTATLSNGNIALLTRIPNLTQIRLEILDPAGTVLSSRALDATVDQTPIFGQTADGLEVLQVGGRILSLYRDPASQTVFGQFATLAGAADGTEFTISEGEHSDASNAAVWLDGVIDAEVLTNGNVAVVWADSRTGSDGTEVWLKILSPTGATVKAETLANTGATAGEQFHPRVHALDAGGFVVTFDQNFAPASDPAGYARQFDAAGNPVGDLLSFGGGTTNGSAGYGQIFGPGYGLLLDWDGTAQAISVDGATAPVSTPPTPPDPVDPDAPTTGDDVLTGTADPDTIDGLAGNDQISGLAGNDTLKGGAGNDTLDGGTGTDRMEGGAGDDTYRIDAAGDRIVEAAGNGNDIVRATAQVTLGRAEVEAVILEGSANLRVNGNGFAADITGNDGSNILVSGGGGDTVTGGAGNDFFAFQRSDAGGPVTITDFSAGDKLALDDRFFGLGGAGVDPRAVTDQQATSALRSEAFSYNRSTGELFVDLDARGGPLEPILIAVIEGGVSIGQDDVLLF